MYNIIEVSNNNVTVVKYTIEIAPEYINFKLSFFLLNCSMNIDPNNAILETNAISSIPEYPNTNNILKTNDTENSIHTLFNKFNDLLKSTDVTSIATNNVNNFIELSSINTLVNIL